MPTSIAEVSIISSTVVSVENSGMTLPWKEKVMASQIGGGRLVPKYKAPETVFPDLDVMYHPALNIGIVTLLGAQEAKLSELLEFADTIIEDM